jgi:type I restriction enzyme R subunit
MKYRLNESQTEYELIEPALRKAGWGEVDGSHILKQHPITDGRLIGNGKRGKILKADYVLVYKNRFLAIIEAKAKDKYHTDGLAQAKQYATMLELRFTYSTNGVNIYQVDMSNATEGLVDSYPTPDKLWDMTFGKPKLNNKIDWQAEFNSIPYENFLGKYQPRYYQRNAIENVLEAVAKGKDRILLTMATGTGKTAVAFHICWKLFQASWNIQRDSKRLPRILFLADRNGLANQAFNAFSAFDDDALERIKPNEIRKKGGVPKNRSIFFTIFQTFMSGEYVETDEEDEEYEKTEFYTEYDKDFFDFIIIDECHRGGANDESSWRDILNYFSPAVQLGLTATPKRTINADTYSYFGNPVYTYSLKEGINDGFLTPFRVKQISTTLDEYNYTPGDKVVSGEIDERKVYKESDFNRTIEIDDRELARVKIFLNSIKQNEKSLVFCSTQDHAAKIRDMINQVSPSKNTEYCVRVTADDGERGEQYLRDFQNDEKMIPTILTTSKKLSTGIDAPEVKNIVLLREVKSMIEFKQIIGRGTRIYDGKDYFTVFDFVKAHEHFIDPEWDGEPLEPEPKQPKPDGSCGYCGKNPCECEGGIIKDPCLVCGNVPCICEKPQREKIVVKLSNNTVRTIQSMEKTTFFDASGRVISSDEFVNNLYGGITQLFKNEDELRETWSLPSTRRELLKKLEEIGYNKQQLEEVTELVNGQNSDLYDVLSYIAFNKDILDRQTRAENVESNLAEYNANQQEFIKFVLSQYIKQGVEELDDNNISELVNLKYHAIADAKAKLGDITNIRNTFTGFQKYLYQSLYS